ncbi:MAG: hypothetical protein KJ653_07740 [Candidatus Thermoplasmatota archaeon]|nr:hypothetical protein [Candidatus Thermoplasmatota archaeon]
MQLSTDPEKLVTKNLRTTTDSSKKDLAHDKTPVAIAMKPLATKVPTAVFDWVVREAQVREVTTSSVVRRILERAHT